MNLLGRVTGTHPISPSVGVIPSRAIGLPGIIFATLGVSPAGCLGPNPYYASPKVTNIPLDQITTPLLWNILSVASYHVLKPLTNPTTRTLPPCRQHCFTPLIIKILLMPLTDFPSGSDCKVSVYNASDLGSIPGLGRFPGEGNGNPLQYSCLENPMDGGAWCRLLSMGSQRVRHD